MRASYSAANAVWSRFFAFATLAMVSRSWSGVGPFASAGLRAWGFLREYCTSAPSWASLSSSATIPVTAENACLRAYVVAAPMACGVPFDGSAISPSSVSPDGPCTSR